MLTLLLVALSLYTQYVNPFVGTDAHGHTFPGACAPFGMIQPGPDTRPNAGDWDGCSGYHYSDSLIYGFSHTHLSGTGCDDWCVAQVAAYLGRTEEYKEYMRSSQYSFFVPHDVPVRDGERSFTTRSVVHKIQSDKDIQILSRCSSQYTAGGPEGLIDGRRGGINWRTGGWQGYQNTDFEAVVDLRELRAISKIGAGFCQDARSWIWMPTEVEFAVSADGVHFEDVGIEQTPVEERDMKVQVWDCELPFHGKARYIRIRARNIGPIPDWHPGAGYPGFIFIDEIWVE